MAEWSIAPVLKTDVLRGTGGSNPSLSAENVKWEPYGFPFFCVITRALRSQVAENEGLRWIWTDSKLMHNDRYYLIIIIALVITNLITHFIFRLILVINFM